MMKIITLLKTFVYQAGMNHDNMQGTGFKFLLRDAAKRYKVDVKEEDFKAQAEYFHTHPYLVTYIIGMWLREYQDGGKPDFYKKVYASAFGALGDSFFWHSLRPISFIGAAICALFEPVAGLIFFLMFFNLFHFAFKFPGLQVGYVMGKDIISFFNRIKFNRWPEFFDMTSAFLLGVMLAILFKSETNFNIDLFFIGVGYLILGMVIAKKTNIVIASALNFLATGIFLYFFGV